MTTGFYERYWQREKAGHLADLPLKWPKLAPHIPREPGSVIVDFGCGTGAILREIQRISPTARLIGLDVSKVAIEQARTDMSEAEFCVIQDGAPFPLREASVDFVFSSEVIEHVYDTENAVTEIARILKPGGRLLLTTPYHGLIKNMLIVFWGFDRHFSPTGPHVRFFSKRTLFGLLEKKGLRILNFGYYGRFFPVPHSIYLLAQK